MWGLIQRLNKNNRFYHLIGKKLVDRRKNKIRKMTNQSKLFKIILTEQVGWLEALDMITDPAICEEIYRSENLQPRLRYCGSYFANRAKLIDKLNDKALKQELYIEAIQREIETIKNYYKRYSSQIECQDFDLANLMLKMVKYVVNYMNKIENTEQRIEFLLSAADICDHAPTSVLVPTSRIQGRMSQPTNDTREFGREIRCDVEILMNP